MCHGISCILCGAYLVRTIIDHCGSYFAAIEAVLGSFMPLKRPAVSVCVCWLYLIDLFCGGDYDNKKIMLNCPALPLGFPNPRHSVQALASSLEKGKPWFWVC